MKFIINKFFGQYIWPLRKLRFMSQKGLVAYLGTDINPPSRADIIIIPKSSATEPILEFRRLSKQIICYSDCAHLPFQDKVIDYFILSNALDFSLDPQRLLNEVCRIAKSGYIESPNVLLERFYPHPKRISELALLDNKPLI